MADSNVDVFSQLEVTQHSGLCEFHTMPRAPNHWGEPKSRNSVSILFFNAVQLLPNILGSNMEALNLIFPRAQSNLGTSLCHTVNSSQKSHLWCLHLS